MRIPKHDFIATGMVAIAAVLFVFWVTDLLGTRPAGIVILGLGFAASAVAVVPGFDQLIHGSKTAHHMRLAKAQRGAGQVCPHCGNTAAALGFCDVCGYDLVERARTKTSHMM